MPLFTSAVTAELLSAMCEAARWLLNTLLFSAVILRPVWPQLFMHQRNLHGARGLAAKHPASPLYTRATAYTETTGSLSGRRAYAQGTNNVVSEKRGREMFEYHLPPWGDWENNEKALRIVCSRQIFESDISRINYNCYIYLAGYY
jgi:hypothetical protein